MTEAVLSLGSNQGDRFGFLQLAVDLLRPWVVSVSPVFRTPPWGPVAQADYLNAVVLVADPGASAEDWLHRCQACEKQARRTRDVRWGPRTLDVDVVSVDDLVSDDPVLTLPHPRAAQRAFVLVPWWAVNPEATMPGGSSVLELLNRLPDSEVQQVQLMPGLELQP